MAVYYPVMHVVARSSNAVICLLALVTDTALRGILTRPQTLASRTLAAGRCGLAAWHRNPQAAVEGRSGPLRSLIIIDPGRATVLCAWCAVSTLRQHVSHSYNLMAARTVALDAHSCHVCGGTEVTEYAS
jgi:hypothetical protein